MQRRCARLLRSSTSKTRFQPVRASAGASLFGGAFIINSHTASYWSDIMRALRAKTRCEKCGFALEVDKHTVHERWKIDPELWAKRCKAREQAQLSPFDCPHLKAATSRAARAASLV